MSSPMTKQDLETQPRQAIRISSTQKRFSYSLVVFAAVLIVLLGLRHVCSPFAATSVATIDNNDLEIQTVDTYDENQLQEVATLMEEIYTILANTSFIPHESIERGPHQINTTATPCEPDAADLRLMEILPYVNTNLSGYSNWLWGGTFVDYRKDRDLRYACDPDWVEKDFSYIMRPGIVHLTEGGWEDRDRYRTWKLQYDTRKHVIRVYEGDEWLPYNDYWGEPMHYEYRRDYGLNDMPIFGGENTTGRLSVNRHSRDWREWTDAPTFLTMIRDAYLSTAWSPWDTWEPDRRQSILPGNITSALLLKNGWPDKFDVDQFRANLIRAQHKPSGQGWAEGAFREIRDHRHNRDDGFNIQHRRSSLRIHQDRLEALETENLTDGPSLWNHMFSRDNLRREVERQDSDFEDAKNLIQRLCLNDTCVEEEDLILWEFRKLENTYTKAQLEPNATTMCEWRELPPDQLSRCISQLNLERYWLQLAYQQSRADAYAHCARNNKHLLPPASFEALASRWIAEYERNIAEYDLVSAQLDAWQERTGAPKSTMDFLRKEYDSAKAWDTRLYKGKIEEIVRSLAGGDSDEVRLKLWNDLESPRQPRSWNYLDEKVFY
ncbi:hypothetical protein ACET3X_003515 [Alternaria dauci]|uniref:Uncharacterized protein n=1 Tax=Alternaria dauci TaxID=48095 RepID=A0ABR3USS5_9PLEO